MLMKVNQSVKVALICQGIFMFSFQFLSSYTALYAQFLGADGLSIGLLLFTSALIQGVFSLYIVRIIERYSLKKVMLLGVSMDIIAISLFILSRTWYSLFIPFILLQIIKIPPLTDMMITSFTSFNERGTVFGLSRFLNGICLFSSSMITAAILSLYQISEQTLRMLFFISLFPLLTISIILLRDPTLYEEKKKRNLPKAYLLKSYVNVFKNREIRLLVIARLMRECAFQSLVTFVPLWLVNFRSVTGTQLGFLIMISTFASIICQIPAGKLADVYGRKRVFYMLDIFYCVGIILLVFAPSEYLLLAALCGMGAFGGGIGGAAMVPFFTMWWESVSTNDVHLLYGIDGIIISVARIFSLLWGILWNLKFNTAVILIPLLIELLIVIPLLSKLTSPSNNALRLDN